MICMRKGNSMVEEKTGEADDVVCMDGEDLASRSASEESSDEAAAEKFAYELVRRAISLTGVKVEREKFFRNELAKYSSDVDVERAIASTPIAAGMTPEQVDKAARAVIDFETKKCSAISFAAGIPGGFALAGTVPADLAQYFAHVLRVEQKLAYLYGWQTFLDDNDEIDDETILELVILMGVMLGVGAAVTNLTRFAAEIAMPHVVKTIERKALTKTAWYPLMKKILGAVGVQVTKSTFAKTAGKVVPVIGGVVSGGMTYASFKPSAERLRVHLRALPVSGIAVDAEDAGKDVVSDALLKASEGVGHAATAATDAAKQAGAAAAEGAKEVGAVAADGAQKIGAAASEAASFVGKTASQATHAAAGFLGSLRKKK